MSCSIWQSKKVNGVSPTADHCCEAFIIATATPNPWTFLQDLCPYPEDWAVPELNESGSFFEMLLPQSAAMDLGRLCPTLRTISANSISSLGVLRTHAFISQALKDILNGSKDPHVIEL